MNITAIKNIRPLGFQWETSNPFLFCVHHLDNYPAGNDDFGPAASLEGRDMGQDFTPKDGWRMYHGKVVPGFPEHPHRGFETVTIVLKGMVDHSDSMGLAGRYGNGDVQWMTAGKGMQHAEMFPLLKKNEKNPLELFQIWLNLPARNKFVEPYYKMLWSEDIPNYQIKDDSAKSIEVSLIAGKLWELEAIAPTPDSWAAEAENEVAIWLVKMEAGAKWDLPVADASVNRTLFFYSGSSLKVEDQELIVDRAADLHAHIPTSVENGKSEGYFLLLQGKPINEPVAQYGPFVMNTQAEIQQAIKDYRSTQFGGWPWPRPDQVHGPDKGRFAQLADGTEETRD